MTDQSSSLPTNDSSEERQNQKDRGLQFKIALVGSISALFGALIGGIATYVGSVNQEHSAAAAQIQSERENYYISYDVATNKFLSAAFNYYIRADSGLSTKTALKNVESTDVQFGNANGQTTIIASPALASLARSQNSTASRLYLDVQLLAFRVADPRGPVTVTIPAKATLVLRLRSEIKVFEKQSNTFSNLARSDLGTN